MDYHADATQVWINEDFTGESFVGKKLAAKYIVCKFRRCDFTNANLAGEFQTCDFTEATLKETLLPGSFLDCPGIVGSFH